MGTSRDAAVKSIIEDSKAAGDISKALKIAIEAIGAANLRDNDPAVCGCTAKR